jgi:hypothetical protein
MERDKFFTVLCRKPKVCDINKAMFLAKESNYDLEVIDTIFKRSDCLFSHLWELLNKAQYITPVLENAVKNKSFRKISFEQLNFLLLRRQKEMENYRGYEVCNVLADMNKQKSLDKFSIEELFYLGQRFGYWSAITDNINRKKAWQEMDFETVHQLLIGKNLSYYQELQDLMIHHRSCPQELVRSTFYNARSPWEMFETIATLRHLSLDFVLDKTHALFIENFDDMIASSSYFIIARSDCSITVAQEILEKARSHDSETFSYAAMALIEKSNFSFKKALKLMREINCTRGAISSFEKRKDFTLEKRIKLIRLMNQAIPEIYENGDEPHYDHFDEEAMLKVDDWKTRPLADVLSLYHQISHFSCVLEIIAERSDWKKLSFNQAVKLVAETGNTTSVLQLIIKTKKCSLTKALKIAKFPGSELCDAHLLNTIITEGIALPEETLELVEKSNDAQYTVAVIADHQKASLADLVSLSRGGFSNLGNLSSAISKHEDWKTVPLATAFDFIKDQYKEPLRVIVAREDWQALPFIEAEKLLQTIKWDSEAYSVVLSLTVKPDCPLDKAKELVDMLDPSHDIRKAIYPVVSRIDNPLDDALELAKRSYHGSFEGIAARSDWQTLPLTKVAEYIEKYSNYKLVESLADREDWKALPFEEATQLLGGKDDYCHVTYLGLVVHQSNKPLDKVLAFLEEHKYTHFLSRQVINRGDCSLDLASEIFRKTELNYNMFSSITEREDWPQLSLRDALNFAKKTGGGFYSTIVEKREDWQKLSFAKSLKLAKQHSYNNFLNSSIVGKMQ